LVRISTGSVCSVPCKHILVDSGAMLAIDKHMTTIMSCCRVRNRFKVSLYFPVAVDCKILYHAQYGVAQDKVLSVMEAPEPAKIKWENLGYDKVHRYFRRGLTVVLAMLLVVVSVGITYGAKALQQSSIVKGGTSLCPADFESMADDVQISYVEEHSEDLHCYCDQFSYQQQASISMCKKYLKSTVQAQILTYFSSVVVLFVSTLIDMAIRMFADYEKHHTQDSKEKSIFLRVFVLQYLNTSCVFLINDNQKILSRVFGISGSSTTEFSSQWYNSIGVTIILVQLGNILSSQAGTIYAFLKYHFKLRAAVQSKIPALTQAELNKAIIGPDFVLSTRYAQTLSTLFVCLTFSSGIPLLYFVAAANFCASFWIDKFVFVRLCKEPKPYSAKMGQQATMLIPIGVVFHLAMSVWMLSNKEIFSSDVDAQISQIQEQGKSNSKLGNELLTKITFKQTVPLFALLCAILGIFFLYHFLKRVRGVADVVKLFFVGNSEIKNKIEVLQFIRDEGVVETFSGLVYAGKMKGLTTYNILQNPDYKEAFGITWSFAFKHQRLKSLYNFKTAELTKAISIEDEEEDILDHAMAKQQKHMKKQARKAANYINAAKSSPTPTVSSGSTKRTTSPPPKPPRNPTALKRGNSEYLRQRMVLKDDAGDDDIEAGDDDDDDDDDDEEEEALNEEFEVENSRGMRVLSDEYAV
jgi:NADH:ubiquinone oxidoreductase subunit 6 (subunit J)